MFSLPLKLGVVAMVMGYVIVVRRWVCPGSGCLPDLMGASAVARLSSLQHPTADGWGKDHGPHGDGPAVHGPGSGPVWDHRLYQRPGQHLYHYDCHVTVM